jgi:hypothetical protein
MVEGNLITGESFDIRKKNNEKVQPSHKLFARHSKKWRTLANDSN